MMNWSRVKTIFFKVLAVYFNSPIAYIFIAIFLVVSSWLFWQDFFLLGQANIRNYLSLLPWLLLFLTPAITMRLWSEEKRMGTLEILLTLPVRDSEVVWGKYLSGLAFLLLNLLLSLTIPITVSLLGNLDWGVVAGGYLGSLFLGAAYLALGMFISSLSKNQIISLLVAIVANFFFYIIGSSYVVDLFGTGLASVLSYLGLSSHFGNITKGVIDSRDLVYYLSFIGFFLFLNIKSLASRHWK